MSDSTAFLIFAGAAIGVGFAWWLWVPALVVAVLLILGEARRTK